MDKFPDENKFWLPFCTVPLFYLLKIFSDFPGQRETLYQGE